MIRWIRRIVFRYRLSRICARQYKKYRRQGFTPSASAAMVEAALVRVKFDLERQS